MIQGKKRILIVRLGSMGDIIHGLPVAATLKETFPEWEIDWLVESRWRDLIEGNPSLTNVISLETIEWRKQPMSPGVWGAIRCTIAALQARHYDYALDLQGAVKSAVAAALSGARSVVGFDKPWVKEAACAALYTRRVRTAAVHVVEANLALAAALGADPKRIRFPLPAGDPARLPSDLPQDGFAVFNPGAGWRSKCWPPENYAAVADALQENLSLPVILNCGPGEETLARKVYESCRQANPKPYLGDIKSLIALLRRARLMVGPDTGPLHLAAALGVPTVGLFGPTDPRRNGPYGKRQRTLRPESAKTSYRHSSVEGELMRGIHPEQVVETIYELLEATEECIRQPRPL